MNIFDDPAFMMYVLEEEGELDTHTSMLNKLANQMRGMSPEYVDTYLSYEALSYEDILYVKQRAGVI